MNKEISRLLQTDEKHRTQGVTTDLYTLEHLDTQKSWDYSLPTLSNQDNAFLKNRLKSLTNDKFIETFYSRHPEIKELDWNNLLAAGGSIGSIICDTRDNNDVDFFIYGLNENEAIQKIEEICQTIISSYEKEDEKEDEKVSVKRMRKKVKKVRRISPKKIHVDMRYARTKNTLTINEKYQIIFRLYTTKSEILHGFDLGSSAIGFDGENVLFTSLSKFAYENRCNIIDTTRRSTTYEHRLIKYFHRGFEIIFPFLDISKLSTDLWDELELPEVCKLPFFTFTYKGRQGNKILFSKFFLKKGYKTSDYDKDEWNNEYAMFHVNIMRLLDKEFDSIIYVSDDYDKILNHPVCFSMAKVDYFYNSLAHKISSRNFPTRAVEKYIRVEEPETVFEKRKDKEEIQAIIFRQVKAIKKLLKKLSKHDKKIPFITENPGTQLTSSFNPIMEEPQEWYGEYMK